MSPLSPAELERLAALEAIIEPRLESWIAVGLALLEIKQAKLYRVNYPTFEAYCKERWQMGRSRAYQLISGALVAEVIDDPQATESTIRPLTSLPANEAALVWQVVRQTAPDGKVTGRHVKAVASVLKDILHTGAVDDGDGGQLPVAQASIDHLKAAVTETAYEAMMRQQQRLAEASEPVISFTMPLSPALIHMLPKDVQDRLMTIAEAKIIIKPLKYHQKTLDNFKP